MLNKFFRSLIILLILIAVLATKGFGKTYYVDSSVGNDNNDGLSPSTAWQTINKINNFVFVSMDTISFKCGDRFAGYTLIPNNDSLTFNSYGSGDKPIIDGQGTMNCVTMSYKTNIKFENIKFVYGFPRDIAFNNNNFITIESCNIDSCSGTNIYHQNIYTGQGSHLIIRNSTISYAGAITGGGHGIYIDGTDNTTLEYDTLLSNMNDNIRIAYGYDNPYYTDSLIVRYCVIKYAGDENISDDGSRYSKFYYNVFENETKSWSENISLFSSSGYSASGNQYFNNTIIVHDPDNHDNSGFFVYKSTGTTNMQVFNNIFYLADSLTGWAFYSQSAPIGSWTIDHNLYYSVDGTEKHCWHWENNTLSSFADWKSQGFDTNGVYGNPSFISNGNYALQDSSPAINLGQPNAVSKDINNNLVPSPTGTNPDAGAFENTTSYGIHDSLPVEIININIEKGSSSVILTWQTATETNNKGFEIERRIPLNPTLVKGDAASAGGDFENIGFVQGKGNSTEKSYYKFVDDYSKINYKGNVEYRIKQIDLDGTYSYSGIIGLNVDFSVKTYSLEQNYPNPFNPSTSISYQLPAGGYVTLKVYDMLGKVVKTLVNEYKTEGKYSVNFDGSNLSSGIYFYSIYSKPLDGSKEFHDVKKMILLK